MVGNAFPGNAVEDVGKDAATLSSAKVDDKAGASSGETTGDADNETGKFLEHFFSIRN